MDNTSPPTKIYTPFASGATSGYITAVPQTTTTPGQFSWLTGSGPETFLAPVAGGTPPLGDSFNGLVNQLSANIRWNTAGQIFPYDATFSANIGGYAKNSVLFMGGSNPPGLWVSTANNNTVNPDTGTPSAPATGWAVLSPNTYPWSSITGVPSFVLNSQFTGSNVQSGTNGWQNYPNGQITQWCELFVSLAANQSVGITYPKPFLNTSNRPRVNIMQTSLVDSNFMVAIPTAYSLTGCTVQLALNGGGNRDVTILVDVRGT